MPNRATVAEVPATEGNVSFNQDDGSERSDLLRGLRAPILSMRKTPPTLQNAFQRSRPMLIRITVLLLSIPSLAMRNDEK